MGAFLPIQLHTLFAINPDLKLVVVVRHAYPTIITKDIMVPYPFYITRNNLLQKMFVRCAFW